MCWVNLFRLGLPNSERKYKKTDNETASRSNRHMHFIYFLNSRYLYPVFDALARSLSGCRLDFIIFVRMCNLLVYFLFRRNKC